MNHRAIALLAVSAIVAACSPANAPSADRPSAGGGSGTSKPAKTEAEVRQDLISEGYGEIQELRSQPDGSWTARAVLDGKERQVTITPQGFVFPR